MLTRKKGDPSKGGTLEVFICWLEVDKRVKEGSIVTLKGERKRWKVEKQFTQLRTTELQDNKKWKVGGLY